MELNYSFYDGIDELFIFALEDARRDNLGLYYFEGEVYLPNCLHSYYFLNVTSYIYENLYEVYTFGEFHDFEKMKLMTRIPLTTENFFKKGW